MKVPQTASRIWSTGRHIYLDTGKHRYRVEARPEELMMFFKYIHAEPIPEKVKTKVEIENHPIRYTLKAPPMTTAQYNSAYAILKGMGVLGK